MGTVWRAYDRSLGREVAVKEIRQDPALNAVQRRELRERTIREGRMAARVSHPSVATVHDVIEVDGSPWIVMELVEGRSLQQVIDEDGPLPPRLVAEIGSDLLAALRAAHAQGILHRDVKPANVLLTEAGRVVLTDFGIAKALGDSALTRTGMVVGSPGYTAPERARGEHTGPASDLWSLGATLYFAVEGRPAYERGSVSATLSALMTESAEPPAHAGPLRPVIEGLLEKDQAVRLAPERVAALLRIVADTPMGSPVASEASPSGASAAVLPGATAGRTGEPLTPADPARKPSEPGGPAPGGPTVREQNAADRTTLVMRPPGGAPVPPAGAVPHAGGRNTAGHRPVEGTADGVAGSGSAPPDEDEITVPGRLPGAWAPRPATPGPAKPAPGTPGRAAFDPAASGPAGPGPVAPGLRPSAPGATPSAADLTQSVPGPPPPTADRPPFSPSGRRDWDAGAVPSGWPAGAPMPPSSGPPAGAPVAPPPAGSPVMPPFGPQAGPPPWPPAGPGAGAISAPAGGPPAARSGSPFDENISEPTNGGVAGAVGPAADGPLRPPGLGTDLFSIQGPPPPDAARRTRVIVLMGVGFAAFIVLVVVAMAILRH
jgi:hypothetical protein